MYVPLVSLKETSLRSSVRGGGGSANGVCGGRSGYDDSPSFGLPINVEEDRRLLMVIFSCFPLHAFHSFYVIY